MTPGRESDFVRAWTELGDWTVKAFPGAHGTLLRDTERPNVFISFGPWPDRDPLRAGEGPATSDASCCDQETPERFDPMLLETSPFPAPGRAGRAVTGVHGFGTSRARGIACGGEDQGRSFTRRRWDVCGPTDRSRRAGGHGATMETDVCAPGNHD